MEEEDDRGRRGNNVWVLLRQAWRRGWSCFLLTPEAEDDNGAAASGTCCCSSCPHNLRWSSLLLLVVRVLLLMRRRTSIACFGERRAMMTWMMETRCGWWCAWEWGQFQVQLLLPAVLLGPVSL